MANLFHQKPSETLFKVIFKRGVSLLTSMVSLFALVLKNVLQDNTFFRRDISLDIIWIKIFERKHVDI